MKILFIGDVFGKAGRQILTSKLPSLIKDKQADFVIANVENITHGKGTRQKDIDLLKSLGVNVFTGGNHTFDVKDILNVFEKENTVIRPANYPPGVPGEGFCIYNNVLIINLLGRIFMKEGFDSPFQIVDQILEDHKKQKFEAIIVDFHAETTSEKAAMFHYLNGRVTALIGTHTHVQTADEQVSKQGTAFISDVGMTGPRDSIIGMETETVLYRFVTALPKKFEPSEKSPIISAVLIEIKNMKAKNIERILLK